MKYTHCQTKSGEDVRHGCANCTNGSVCADLYEALVAAKAIIIFWEKLAVNASQDQSPEMRQINAALALAEGKEAKRA